jgi:hypothetical protein
MAKQELTAEQILKQILVTLTPEYIQGYTAGYAAAVMNMYKGLQSVGLILKPEDSKPKESKDDTAL